MATYHLEQDTQYRYTPNVGNVPEGVVVHCGVCQCAMDEHRGQIGPRGFAEAMAGSKSEYDEFTCPNSKVDWHRQIVALRMESQKTASYQIRSLLIREAQHILQTKSPSISEPELSQILGRAGHYDLMENENEL